jgi:Ala-tRNA(Pro) deacylase
MSCRKRLEKLFREENVRFSVIKHAEEYGAQRVAGVVHIPGQQLAKVVMVYAGEQPAMLVMPAPYRLDMAKVKKALSTKGVRLAGEGEFTSLFPDCEVGAMPPYGRLYGIPVYVDRTLSAQSQIAFRAGSHREVFQIAFADYERTADPEFADFCKL